MAFRKGGFGGAQRGGFRPGGRPQFGGDKRGFGGPRSESSGERFTAVCADCGNTCDVPFRPNGKKPVYCKACFPKHHADTRGERDFSRGPVPRSFERREPSFVPAPRPAAPDHRIDTIIRDIATLSAKVDALAQILAARATPAAAPVRASAPTKKTAKKTATRKK